MSLKVAKSGAVPAIERPVRAAATRVDVHVYAPFGEFEEPLRDLRDKASRGLGQTRSILAVDLNEAGGQHRRAARTVKGKEARQQLQPAVFPVLGVSLRTSVELPSSDQIN